MSDADHHNLRSPLLDINPPIDMVKSFSLDFLHIICLGVMKALLKNWIFGKVGERLTPKQKAVTDKLIGMIKNQLPEEFQRRPRTIFECLKFKATEFRLILLYIGPLIFKRSLPLEKYKHFMILHSALRILCSADTFSSHKDLAKHLLRMFFQIAQILYGLKYCTSNLHGLVHLAEDIDTFGCDLNKTSAFYFESFLGNLKNKVRTSYKPLVQVCRRLDEQKQLGDNKPQLPEKVSVETDKQGNIKYLKFLNRFIVKTKRPDNCVILQSNKILYVTKIFILHNTIFLTGIILVKFKSAYSYPLSSNDLNFFKVTVNAEEISNKMIFV